MNTKLSGYYLNRPDTYQVIRGDSDDWCHLHTDSAYLEQLCQTSFITRTYNASQPGLVRALELLLTKLTVLLHHSQSLEAYLQGTPLPLLPGSANEAKIILISDSYFSKLLEAVALLKKLLQHICQSDSLLPSTVSQCIARNYTSYIRQCLTPEQEDFQQLSEVAVIH
ncbi:hypothetical protein [Aliamphritea spongicola]|uniref:hypothetical protein n=1 Tax=Aliamphritea spongicola TaxID=707589 RepID=UPI00196B62FE|nr:hypothetical protein [Aliamphritea spongicola]MBN3562667.1 hypothetical protein [Aliamphritea spongicola]